MFEQAVWSTVILALPDLPDHVYEEAEDILDSYDGDLSPVIQRANFLVASRQGQFEDNVLSSEAMLFLSEFGYRVKEPAYVL